MLSRLAGFATMMPHGVRSVLRNFSYLFGSQALTTIVGACYAVFLARFLGPQLYGTLNYGYAWYLTFIAFTYLGLDVVLGREVGREPKSGPFLAGATLVLRAVAAAVVAVLSAVIACAAEPDAQARTLLYVLSAALFGRAVWLWCGSVFVAYEDTRHQFLIDVAFRPLELATAVLVLLFVAPKSIIAVGVVHAALWWLQAAVGLATILEQITAIEIRGLGRHAQRLIVEGLPGALYTLAVIWFLQAPTVWFRHLVGTGDALGYFALAIQIVGYLLIVPYLVGSVALPVLSRSAAREDGKTRIAAFATLIGVPAASAVLGVLALWLAAPVTALVFGARYLEAGRILAEAIWLLLPLSLAIGLQQIAFSHRGNLRLASLSTILGILAMAALYAPLTQAMSYHGALLATGIGMSIWAGGLVLTLAKAGILAKRPPAEARIAPLS